MPVKFQYMQLCGISLIISGFLILCDWPKVLLSRLILPIVGSQNLPQPPLYYAALVLLGTGLIICSAAVLGCWSACIFNYFILTILVLILLLSECIIYGMLWLWPGCIGLTVSPTYLARTLQRNYGKTGFEQYTAAVDYAQTNLNCCGITSSLDYDASIWKLHGVAKMENGVPMTCCIITNIHDPMAYMRPLPLNQTKCQISEAQKNVGFRHQEGCSNKLKKWYEKQYGSFFIAGIFVILIEFFVLLIILLACTRVNRSRLNDHNSNSNDSRSTRGVYNLSDLQAQSMMW
ncbi:tetraspanin-36 [Chrysoperla carnea]|uniref:tetraspanin-36 n=1 Tax=Chrysoperla carnea TaxID=189513 RepID=UPI001D096CD8|nr:tetraspanin-36 [Chrysoperla carnea]